MGILQGDVRKGLDVARELGSRAMTRDWAEMLEQMNQLNEVALQLQFA